MPYLSFGRLFDLLTSTEFFLGMLWTGLGFLSITLLVLMQTRWGQARPLRKCLVLSLLAHLLMAGYATTVQIVSNSHVPLSDPSIQVTLLDGSPEDEKSEEKPVFEENPWDALPRDMIGQPEPGELTRLEMASSKLASSPQMVEHVAATLPKTEALERIPLSESVAPRVESLPSDATPSKRSLSKVIEPIDAPLPKRHEANPLVAESAKLARKEKVPQAELVPIQASKRYGSEHAFDSLPKLDRIPTTHEPATIHTGEEVDMAAVMAGKKQAVSVSPEPTQLAGGALSATHRSEGADSSQSGRLWQPSRDVLEVNRPMAPGSGLTMVPISREAGPPQLAPRRIPQATEEIPAAYRLRVASDRSRIAERHGATTETEAAVKAALRWLAENQSADGHWDAQQHDAGHEAKVAGRDRYGAGNEANTGMTGLALLTFLASGHTHQKGIYQENIRKGLLYLVKSQAHDGNLRGSAKLFAGMYCHGIATIALSESYAMTRDQSLLAPLERAVRFTLNAQDTNMGGWRYTPRDPGDTSQLGWQVMVLKSAELADISIPASNRQLAIRFLNSVSSGNYGGMASYRAIETPSRAMTAEALTCRQYLLGRVPPALAREAGDYLLGELPGEGEVNYYYWYYGTLSLYQLQGPQWKRWNEALQTTLLRRQRTSGTQAGSWDPDTVWGGYGGRVYSTSMATLCLEVYYRYLPLFVEAASLQRRMRY